MPNCMLVRIPSFFWVFKMVHLCTLVRVCTKRLGVPQRDLGNFLFVVATISYFNISFEVILQFLRNDNLFEELRVMDLINCNFPH